MGKRVSLAEELNPLMRFARAVGVAPYTLKNNIYKISPCAIFYTTILTMMNIILIIMRMYEIRRRSRESIKMEGLSFVVAVSSSSSIILNTFYTLLHRREFGELFKIINKFDASINLRPATKKHFATIWTLMLSSIVMSVIYTVVSVYKSEIATIYLINRALMVVRNIASIGFFLAMLCSMLRRFQKINRIIERDSKNLDASDIVLRKSMGLRKVWTLYDQLIDATEKLNAMYSAELLAAILMSSFNLLRRLHMQWNQYELNPIDIVLNVMVITPNILKLLFLTWFCHMTSSMAINVAAEAFRVNSSVLKFNHSWDDEDIFVIGQYFLLRRSFQITAGGGFLHINLPLLRTIVATITTYLVILKSPGEKRQRA